MERMRKRNTFTAEEIRFDHCLNKAIRKQLFFVGGEGNRPVRGSIRESMLKNRTSHKRNEMKTKRNVLIGVEAAGNPPLVSAWAPPVVAQRRRRP